MIDFDKWWNEVGCKMRTRGSEDCKSIAHAAYEAAINECIRTRSDWDLVALKAFVTRFVAWCDSALVDQHDANSSLSNEFNRLETRARDLIAPYKPSEGK